MEKQKLFLECIEIANEIIKQVEENNIDSIEGLVDKRNEVIKNIVDLNLPKEELERYMNENNMITLEEKVNKVIKEKMLYIKNEIASNNKQKKATNTYNNTTKKAVFLSREV